MIKIGSSLYLVVLFSLLAVPISCTRSYETQIVFVPEASETSLRSAASEGNMDILDPPSVSFRKSLDKASGPDIREGLAIWEKYEKDEDERKTGIKKTQQQFNAEKKKIKVVSLEAKVDECVFDINKLTREGWEIKTSRRVWKDFNDNSEPDSYEWGTEYTLQKKKGWW